MTDQTQRLEIATVKAEIGSNILNRFSNDAIEAAEIPTDSGPIPNLKQVIKAIADTAGSATQLALDLANSSNASKGTGMIGHQGGTLRNKLVSIDSSLLAEKKRASGYLSLEPSGNTISVNANDASTFGVSLTQAVGLINISGAVVGTRYNLDFIFVQGATGYPVTFPASVRIPTGVTQLVSTSALSISLVSMMSVDGGASWYAKAPAIFGATSTSYFPPISDNNASFNDEGGSATGWTPANSTISISGSVLRQTKTAGGANSSITKNIDTFTPSNSDYIFYGRVRARKSADDVGVVWLLNGTKEVSIWFGSNNGGGSGGAAVGSISIVGTTGASTKNIQLIATGVAYDTDYVDFALQYDSRFSTLSCFFREASGRWKWKGRVASDWFSAPTVQALTATPSSAGCWIEFDHLTLSRPNIIVLSDSIGEGKTLFSPNPALSLTNDESTWMRNAPIYPALRNNLIVNKGIGGQDSQQISVRAAADCAGARVVFLHASSNDVVAGFSQASRKLNIQNTVNSIAGAGGQTVLLNASYGTQTGSDNTPTPALRDYMTTSWGTQLTTLTGVFSKINIMTPVVDSNGFLASSSAADGIHPNVAGHAAIGSYIASLG